MHLIGFKPYRRGFVGCFADDRFYVYFTCSRGTFKPIKYYPRKEFVSQAHFMTSLHKFLTLRFFLRRPFPLRSLDAHYLEALGRHLAARLTPDAFCSLRHIDSRYPGEATDSGHPPPINSGIVPPATETVAANHRLA